MEVLENLRFLYLDINRLIIEYDTPIQYETKPIQTIQVATSSSGLRGITSDGNILYACQRSESAILVYNLEGKKIETKPSTTWDHPSDIHLYKNNLYIVDSKQVAVCNLEFKLLSSFPIPHSGWSLKAENDLIYLTQSDMNQVCVYAKNGEVKNTIGSTEPSKKPREFNEPRGITLNESNLYVCDTWNHRIQVLFTTDYSLFKQWGSEGRGQKEFTRPTGICYSEDIVYVGDVCSVQLFDSDGKFIQKMGDWEGQEEGQFNCAWGLCVVNNRLYINDTANNRIQERQFELVYSFITCVQENREKLAETGTRNERNVGNF